MNATSRQKHPLRWALVAYLAAYALNFVLFGGAVAIVDGGITPAAMNTGMMVGCPVGFVVMIVTYRRLAQRPKPGHCPKCGYDLTGNVSGRCPECGATMERTAT